MTLQERADLMRKEAIDLYSDARNLVTILQDPGTKDAVTRVGIILNQITSTITRLQVQQAYFDDETENVD